MQTVVGFIGLGLMGKPMAQNLLKGGHSLVVHSRSRGPVEELVRAGARAAESPAELARQASIVITMLPDTPDVELVLEGADGAIGALTPESAPPIAIWLQILQICPAPDSPM